MFCHWFNSIRAIHTIEGLSTRRIESWRGNQDSNFLLWCTADASTTFYFVNQFAHPPVAKNYFYSEIIKITIDNCKIQSTLQLQSNNSMHMLHAMSPMLHFVLPKSSLVFSLLPIISSSPPDQLITNSVSRDEDPTAFGRAVPHDPMDRICGAIV